MDKAAAWLAGFLDQWDAAYQAGDVSGMTALCTPDVVLDDVGAGSELQGRQAVAEVLGGIFGRGGALELERSAIYVEDDGSGGAAVYRTSRGERVVESIDLFEFRDGLVARWTTFVRDREWIGRQLP